jgi:hypothetical protein
MKVNGSSNMKETEKITVHLERALAEILVALVLSGWGGSESVPTQAIDVTLGRDPNVVNARQAFHKVLNHLPALDIRLRIEEVVNALVAGSADAAYRLGFRVGRAAASQYPRSSDVRSK